MPMQFSRPCRVNHCADSWMHTTVERNLFARRTTSLAWSPCACVTRIASTCEIGVSPTGAIGLPSSHGSTSRCLPRGETRWNAPWPSHVRVKPLSNAFMGDSPISALAAGERRVHELFQPRREVAQDRRLVGEPQPAQPLAFAVELDHRVGDVAHVLGRVHA